MPEMDGIEAALHVAAISPAAFVLISCYHEEELIRRAENAPVVAYLVKPITKWHLQAMIPIAMQRHAEAQTLLDEAAAIRQNIEHRKIVERAKGIIMKHGGLSESDAFHRLQKLSWDRNQKLIEVANIIVMAELAFHEPDRPPASPAKTRRAKIRPSRAG